MTVSIIIAVKTWQKNLEECVDKCRQLDYPDFEIIILPDNEVTIPLPLPIPPVSIIPTGPLSPARKRDIGIKHAQGEILAFLDDDAYPTKNWLKNAIENFKDANVAAVVGPAVTPAEDNPRQKASGLVYASYLVSGKYSYRYTPKKKQEVDDYPSCNFLMRKSVMQELGGFKTDFWPGEDTKLSLDITKRLGRKIIYDPMVLVYHHRRPLLIPHLRQIASYALHRGYFVKRYPSTSLKISYFLPSLFLITLLIGGILSLFSGPSRILYFWGLSLYLFFVFIFSIIGTHPQARGLSLKVFVFIGTVLTHLAYGFYFLKGLFSKKLLEEIGTVPDVANTK